MPQASQREIKGNYYGRQVSEIQSEENYAETIQSSQRRPEKTAGRFREAVCQQKEMRVLPLLSRAAGGGVGVFNFRRQE